MFFQCENIKKLPAIVLILLSLFSCEEVVHPDYQPEQQVCLNCVLNPDSAVRLSLTYTRALDDNNDFVPVGGAQIQFYEDGKAWAVLRDQGGGVYGIEQHPQTGRTYRVEAIIDGQPVLSAETTVPVKPVVDTTIVDKIPNPKWMEYEEITHYYYLTVAYRINDPVGLNYYWNYETWRSTYYPDGHLAEDIAYLTPYADNFNRETDATVDLGFFYHFYVRQTDDGVDGQQLTFRKETSSRTHTDYFFCADEHYDRYLKTSVQSWMIEEWDDLPFKEPVQIYSNINNGTGIFGSASFTSFRFSNE